MYKLSVFILIALFSVQQLASQTKHSETEILCLKNQEFSEQSNMLYSPAFRAAWTSLSRTIILEPVKLRQKVKLVEELNKATYTPSDSSSWYIKSGYIEKGVIKEIEEELSLKFGITAPGLTNIKDKSEGILNYSLFNYAGKFKVPFEEFSWDFEYGSKKARVKCFGVSKGSEEIKSEMRKQVSIYDYRHRDDFIIRIDGTKDNYEIILAKTEAADNVQQSISEIDSRISESFPDNLGSGDELIIPIIEVDKQKSYKELHGLYLANKGFTDYFIAEAMQAIKFTLNQTGVIAKISGKVLLKKGPVPRIYAFDKPFFLILREKGNSEPSLVLRVYDTCFLQPTE